MFYISIVISLGPLGNGFGKDGRSGTIELLRVNGNLHMTCPGRLYNRQAVSSGLILDPIDSTANFSDASIIIYKLNEGVDFSADFHVFSTEWSPRGFKFLVDGKLVGQGQNPWISGPFDQPVSVRAILKSLKSII